MFSKVEDNRDKEPSRFGGPASGPPPQHVLRARKEAGVQWGGNV